MMLHSFLDITRDEAVTKNEDQNSRYAVGDTVIAHWKDIYMKGNNEIFEARVLDKIPLSRKGDMNIKVRWCNSI